jgi:hypothetical protein
MVFEASLINEIDGSIGQRRPDEGRNCVDDEPQAIFGCA